MFLQCRCDLSSSLMLLIPRTWLFCFTVFIFFKLPLILYFVNYQLKFFSKNQTIQYLLSGWKFEYADFTCFISQVKDDFSVFIIFGNSDWIIFWLFPTDLFGSMHLESKFWSRLPILIILFKQLTSWPYMLWTVFYYSFNMAIVS